MQLTVKLLWTFQEEGGLNDILFLVVKIILINTRVVKLLKRKFLKNQYCNEEKSLSCDFGYYCQTVLIVRDVKRKF